MLIAQAIYGRDAPDAVTVSNFLMVGAVLLALVALLVGIELFHKKLGRMRAKRDRETEGIE